MGSKPIKILVVENGENDTEWLRLYLSDSAIENYQLAVVSSLNEARDTLKDRFLDLIVVDVSSPEDATSRGMRVLRKLCKMAPELPIIALSNVDNDIIAKKAIQSGAQDYLINGEMRSHHLTRAISYAMERNKLIRQLREALESIKFLKGLLPICTLCKKIRDSNGDWSEVESYLGKHSDVQFTHGFCPDCLQKEIENLDTNKTSAKKLL